MPPSNRTALITGVTGQDGADQLAHAYVLAPTWLRGKLRLTWALLSRKEVEFEQLRHTIHRNAEKRTDGHRQLAQGLSMGKNARSNSCSRVVASCVVKTPAVNGRQQVCA